MDGMRLLLLAPVLLLLAATSDAQATPRPTVRVLGEYVQSASELAIMRVVAQDACNGVSGYTIRLGVSRRGAEYVGPLYVSPGASSVALVNVQYEGKYLTVSVVDLGQAWEAPKCHHLLFEAYYLPNRVGVWRADVQVVRLDDDDGNALDAIERDSVLFNDWTPQLSVTEARPGFYTGGDEEQNQDWSGGSPDLP